MNIKEPLSQEELLEIAVAIEQQLQVDSGDVQISREDAAEVCETIRNYLMIKKLVSESMS